MHERCLRTDSAAPRMPAPPAPQVSHRRSSHSIARHTCAQSVPHSALGRRHAHLRLPGKKVHRSRLRWHTRRCTDASPRSVRSSMDCGLHTMAYLPRSCSSAPRKKASSLGSRCSTALRTGVRLAVLAHAAVAPLAEVAGVNLLCTGASRCKWCTPPGYLHAHAHTSAL